jgi:hypothetical protein
MGPAEQNDYYRVFSAYRKGIIRKEQSAAVRREDIQEPVSSRRKLDFDQLSYCACLGLTSPRERLASREVAKTARRGFLAAHAGEPEQARGLFLESWKQWRELEEGLCRTRLMGIIEGYEAYLEYRLNCGSEARRRLGRALDSALRLEQQYGLSLFELHRMQLGHNLARIDWRFGFFEQAFSLAGALVGYLEGKRRDLPFHHDWCCKRLRSTPIYLRKAMIVQIVGEAIGHLVSCSESSYWDTFLSETMIDNEESNSFLFLDPRLWRWLQARRARLQGDRQRYLEVLEEILLPGPRGLGTCYYSIMIDFAEFCANDRSVAAKKVLEFIARDALKWKSFPAALARRLSEICHTRFSPCVLPE